MDRMRYAETMIREFMAPYYDGLPFTPHPCLTKGEWIEANITERDGSTGYRILLDLHGNFSAFGLGYNHEELVEFEIDLLRSGRANLISPAFCKPFETAEFLEKITALSGMDRAVFKNSGTEPYDSAVKVERLWGYEVKGIPDGEAKIVVACDNFHGRSLAATAASTTERRRKGFGPFSEREYIKVPFGDTDALERAVTPTVAGVILEPIQAEAGVFVPPGDYLPWVRKICNANSLLLIYDEVQTGMGRTGKMFAWQHCGEAARPDGMMLGKNVGGGMEILSLLLLREEVGKLLTLGKEGSTFGGSAKSCAVASKVLDILCRPGFLKRVSRLGEEFTSRLRAIKSPLIKEVRGIGFLIGVEFIPEAGGAKFLQKELFYRKDMLAIAREPNTLGFSPPLVISEYNLLTVALHRFEKFVREMEYELGKRNPSF